MQCTKCSSTNVERLSHYWESLPSESPLRARYAPPSEVPSQVWIALLAIAAGIAFMVTGGVVLGLLVAVGGMGFGAFNHAGVQRYRASLAEWSAARICLACTGQF
jgi:uncharacterized membrane protein YgcG